MPETSQKKFCPPGGPGGRVNGGSRGASFLKICILGIFGDISSNLSWDRCQKPPKKILTPRGASFLKICLLGIFGNISSNLSWDRCQKPSKKISTSRPTLLLKIHFKSNQSKILWYLFYNDSTSSVNILHHLGQASSKCEFCHLFVCIKIDTLKDENLMGTFR